MSPKENKKRNKQRTKPNAKRRKHGSASVNMELVGLEKPKIFHTRKGLLAVDARMALVPYSLVMIAT